MAKQTARKTALAVLIACRKNGAWADAALKSRLSDASLSPQDAALCSRMVYGVIQQQTYLDHWLKAYCTQPLERLQPPLAEILRLGAYQILFLDKVPDSAAVNEAVELAKGAGRASAAGLVNAVLRKIAQNKEKEPPLPDDPTERLQIRYSCPAWLIVRLRSILGEEETEHFLQSCNVPAPLTVQVNLHQTTAEQLTETLRAAGVGVAPHPWVENCMELSGTGDLTALPAFANGDFMVQDAAASLASAVSGACAGDRVLDVCAAPGGKSFAMAIAMGDEGEIIACDLHDAKLKRIRDGARRLHLHCIATQEADGRSFHEEWTDAFDIVFCDVPCSGIGILRKKPDIRRKTAEELAGLPAIQSAIIANASRYVRPGGTLIYSTCTVLPEENEAVTDAFLAEHPAFAYEPFTLPIGAFDGHATLWPQRHETDGFYFAKMRRKCDD